MKVRNVTTIVVSMLGSFVACEKPSTPIQNQTVAQAPTATEVFNLRTKCAEFGEKMNNEHDYTGVMPAVLTQEHLSRYDPKNNRCYVNITIRPNLALLLVLAKGNAKALKMRDDFLASYEVDYTERYLYDGQTGEELASMQKGALRVPSTGSIKGRFDKVGWAEAYMYMEELMTDVPERSR